MHQMPGFRYHRLVAPELQIPCPYAALSPAQCQDGELSCRGKGGSGSDEATFADPGSRMGPLALDRAPLDMPCVQARGVDRVSRIG